MAARTRRALLEYCIDRDALLIPGHFEAPHVGRVTKSGETFGIRFGW
jgi:hypothetical protein